MDFVEEYIIGRRSVRSYQPIPVEQEKIEKLVRACFYAPTAMNRDPRSLVIINQRELLDQLPDAQPFCAFAKEAPLAMVVCGEPSKTRGEFWVDDCAASTQNILIAAKAMGLGSCWCGLCHTNGREKKVAELLGIPAEVSPYSLIILGYPAAEGKLPERDLVNTVHYNRW